MLEDLFSVVKVRFNGDKADDDKKKTDIPKGLLFKCPRCRNVTFMEEFQANGKVCPHCNYHSRLTAKERLDITIDKGSFEEFDKDMISKNPIDFPDYEAKQQALREKTGLKDAVLTGKAAIRGEKIVIIVMDSNYMMASMGSVVGEKITRAIEYATANKLPVIAFTASGGARMQEGIVSLMQMAKTSGAVHRLRLNHLQCNLCQYNTIEVLLQFRNFLLNKRLQLCSCVEMNCLNSNVHNNLLLFLLLDEHDTLFLIPQRLYACKHW